MKKIILFLFIPLVMNAQQDKFDQAMSLLTEGEPLVEVYPEEHGKFLCKKAKVLHIAKQTDKAREISDPHTKHTRRWIALMCVFSIIVVPIVAPIFTDVNIAYQIVTEASSGWWIFGET